MIPIRQPIGLGDITMIPPPCMTPERAHEIYTPTFQRVIEYVTNSRISGDVMEFGTFHGYTARTFAELMRGYGSDKELHLYDSWQGFPSMEGNDARCPEVTQHKTWKQGDCTPVIENADKIIHSVLNLIYPRVFTHKGFYNKETPIPKACSVLHIDCDLYESTNTVFQLTLGALQQGSVILFDDWNNNFASNDFGERKAARGFFSSSEWPATTCEIFFNHLEPWFIYGSSGKAFIVQKGSL